MMLGFYNYFSDHPDGFRFDNKVGDYVLTDKATDEDKEQYRKYKEIEQYAEDNDICF